MKGYLESANDDGHKVNPTEEYRKHGHKTSVPWGQMWKDVPSNSLFQCDWEWTPKYIIRNNVTKLRKG